jgi:hypothetical protein
MPPIPEFITALDKMKEIHRTKNDDYAASDNPFSNFDVQEYFSNLFTNPRDKVFVTMLAVKFARLATLMNKGIAPNHESIEDTFIDAANYTLLWRADYIRRKNGREVRTNGESIVGAKHG